MRVPSTQVQNNFGKYLKYVEANEEIIVTRKGKDIAKIVLADPYPDGVREGAAGYQTSGGWVSYEEFLELTEESEQRFELIDGVVYNLASPSYKHQHIIAELLFAFRSWFKGKSCDALTSPFDVTLHKAADNICVVQPDVIVICDRDNRDKKDRYTGVPALVVEVLSPSTRSKDLIKKLDLYKQCGVKEYWIVDPVNEQITVYQLEDNEIENHKTYVRRGEPEVRSFVFEGLTVALDELFG